MSRFSNRLTPNIWWMVLLLAPFVGASISVFSRTDPVGGPLPFGHLWIAAGALVAGLVYTRAMPRLQPIRLGHPEHRRE